MSFRVSTPYIFLVMYIWILDIKVSVNTSYSRQAPGLVTRERTQSRLVTTL